MRRYKLTFHFRNNVTHVLQFESPDTLQGNWDWSKAIILTVDGNKYGINLPDVTHYSVEIIKL